MSVNCECLPLCLFMSTMLILYSTGCLKKSTFQKLQVLYHLDFLKDYGLFLIITTIQNGPEISKMATMI